MRLCIAARKATEIGWTIVAVTERAGSFGDPSARSRGARLRRRASRNNSAGPDLVLSCSAFLQLAVHGLSGDRATPRRRPQPEPADCRSANGGALQFALGMIAEAKSMALIVEQLRDAGCCARASRESVSLQRLRNACATRARRRRLIGACPAGVYRSSVLRSR